MSDLSECPRCGIMVSVPHLESECIQHLREYVAILKASRPARPAESEERPLVGEESAALIGEGIYRSSLAAPAHPAESESGPKKIRRNLSTPEAREFWAHAEQSAAEVETWPEWKRAGINEATQRTAAESESGGALAGCPYCKPGAPCYADDPHPDPAKRCEECKGRGWHPGDCHPREECARCEGTGRKRAPASPSDTEPQEGAKP